MRRKIETGEYALKLLPPSRTRNRGSSLGYGRLTISREEQQRYINMLSGTGTPRISKNGKAQNIEFVTADKPIGTITGNTPTAAIPTKRMAIVHTRDGSYIVPVAAGRTN